MPSSPTPTFDKRNAVYCMTCIQGFSLLRQQCEMGLVVGFKLRLARSTVLRRRSPGPPTPALGRRAGGYYSYSKDYCLYLILRYLLISFVFFSKTV